MLILYPTLDKVVKILDFQSETFTKVIIELIITSMSRSDFDAESSFSLKAAVADALGTLSNIVGSLLDKALQVFGDNSDKTSSWFFSSDSCLYFFLSVLSSVRLYLIQ